MAISKDSDFIAFGGSNKLINVFPFKKIEIGIKKSGEIEPSIDERSHCNFGLYSEEDLPKLILESHNDTVNAIDFTKTHKNYLVSGGSDKCLIIWEILEHNFSYEKLRILKSTSDITDLKIIPNDEFIFASCVDNKIYTWRTNFNGRSFELVYCHNDLHSNFITSICLDPLFNNLNSEEINERIQKSGMRLASYSDDGELVVSEFFYNASGCKSNTMKNFKEFINFKNKSKNYFKSSWSPDSKWIISVNHHYIKNHKIVHARLVNLNDISTSQVLIGHDSAVLIAKFSPTEYKDAAHSNFKLLATSDKNGNLILWKISENKFRILTEISGFSESVVTSLCWSKDGNFLFATNSNGSVYILEFNEFTSVNIKNKLDVSKNNEINEKIMHSSTKKRITPLLINNLSNIQSNNLKNNFSQNSKFPDQEIYLVSQGKNIVNSNQTNQDCLRCQKFKYDSLETKIVQIKIDSFDQLKIAIIYENKVYDNYSLVTLKISDKIFYHNKFENKLIRLFCANNAFYVIYDANNLLSVFTIFNTMV